MKPLILFLFLFISIFTYAGNFTPGNIVVLRIGNGSSLLTSSAHPVFLDEYTRAGVLVQSVALPVTPSGSNHQFTLSGIATSEGTLTLSANGQYLVMAGYEAAPGQISVVGDSTINRVVARVGTNGVANTSTGIIAGAAYSQDNVRAAVSSDGTKFWLAGNGVKDDGGTYYLPFGSFTNSPVKVSTPPNNSRTVSIFNNQLYISSQTNAYNGVSIVGNGLPTTAGATTTLFPGFVSPSTFSVFSFWLFDMSSSVPGMDVLYFCDDRDIAPNGGLYKYSLVNGTWVSNGNVTVPNNLKGITAERTCFTQIFCSSGTKIFSLRDDNGYNQPITGTLTQIAMAATNTKFRGIAFAPGTTTLTALQASAADTDVSCFNAANGSINLTVTGGVSPYTYNWNDNNHSKNRSNLSPGTYQVTVIDANSCTASSSATITQPAQLNVSASKTDVSCNGGNNGTITLTVTGGTPNYTYSWNGGSTSQNRNNLTAATYSVTVTDSKGCTATTSITITQPTTITASTSKTNVSCNGGNNGSVTLTVSGGTTSYTYYWSNNASSQNLNGVPAGTYNVTVTDAHSCTTTSNATITEPAALNVSSTTTDVRCNGGNDGEINLTVSGGISPYTYNWSNGAGSQDISDLSAGTYHVTVQDANGCSTTRTNMSVAQPTTLSSSISKTNVSCNGGSNGAVNLTVSGGTPPYGYSWSNSAAVQDINSLSAGIYNVTITDANNCSITNGTTITQPAALSVSLTKTNVSCNGGSTGSVDLTVSGGTTGYTYLWSNNASSQDLTGVTAGTYNVTVTDANSCTISGGAAITEPTTLTTSLTKTNVSCRNGNNGSIDLAVSGGVAPYDYDWSNQSTSQDINGLTAAIYNVTITDANSCTINNGTAITEPALLTASLVKTDVLCNDDNTGAVDLTVAGGVSPYSYNWSNNAGTQNLTSVSASAYSVTVTDVNNCTATQSAIVSEPAAIVINQIVSDASCNGGADGGINISVGGGIPGYNFVWSTGMNDEDLTGVSSGLYHVTVEDANGCIKSKSIAVGESSALAISLVAKTDVTCTGGGADGTINISAAGGVLPYDFIWNNGDSIEDINSLAAGSYTVTVTDANNCNKVENYVVNAAPILTASILRRNINCNAGNDGSADLTVSGGTTPYSYIWSTGDSIEDLSGITAGIYVVTITDINGCNASVGTLISEPAAITTSLTKTNVNCYGGNDGGIDLSLSGGTAPYTYNWSNQTSLQDAGSLVAGIYGVTITDTKGCTVETGAPILEPTALSASLTQVNVSCKTGSDGMIDLDVTGGSAPYSFDWSNGFGLEDNSGLSAGNYDVTVQDAHGCTTTAGTTITEPDLLVLSASSTDVSCFAGNNGAVTLAVSGGIAAYNFDWSNGDSTQNISGLVVGNYSVTVTDNNGCTALEGVTLTQPTEIVITAAVTNPPCSGGNSGAIDITVSGGVGLYDFIWSNNDTTEDITSLGADTYVVTVSDDNSCVKTFSAGVSQAGTLEVVRVATGVSCNGMSNGSIHLTVSGGTSGYNYLWSDGSVGERLENISAGIFSVTVSDANGCSLAATDTITEPDAISVSASATDISCFGAGNGAVNLSVSGGKLPYNFNWANGAATQEVTGLIAGNYPVTITDENACTVSTSADVTEPDSISVSASIDNASVFGASDGAILLTVEGGIADYAFNWSDSGTTRDLQNIIAGNYCVTVTDENACEVSKCYTVNQPPSAVSEIDGINTFNAYFQNGNLTVSAELFQSADGKLQVFDLAGRLLAVRDFKNTDHIREEVSFSIYADGCYFVNLLTQNGSFTKKIVAVR